MVFAPLSASVQSLPPLPTIKLGPSGADSRGGGGGLGCICSRTLWVSPMNSPVKLGVSPTASTCTGVFNQRFEGFIFPRWNAGLQGLSRSLVVPSGLSARECGTAQSAIRHLGGSTSCCLATSPLCQAACLHPSYRAG